MHGIYVAGAAVLGKAAPGDVGYPVTRSATQRKASAPGPQCYDLPVRLVPGDDVLVALRALAEVRGEETALMF